MSLLKRIEDKGAVLEWSPVASRPDLVALGTKVQNNLQLFYTCIYTLFLFCSLFRILLVSASMTTEEKLSCTVLIFRIQVVQQRNYLETLVPSKF